VNGSCTGNGFESTAMADLLGADFGLRTRHKLYECLDLLLAHKTSALRAPGRALEKTCSTRNSMCWLYDLTSTYCESDPPFPEADKRKFGYSRDKRPDCVQVVIALVVTPEGFSLEL